MKALEGLLSMKDGVPSGPPCPCIPQEARTEFRRCNAYLGTTIPETVILYKSVSMICFIYICSLSCNNIPPLKGHNV